MRQVTGKLASILAMGIAISPMPAFAQDQLGAFSDRQGESQMTIDLVIPFGNDATKKAQNAPRLQLGMAYYPPSWSTGSEFNLWRQREKRTSTIGFTLGEDATVMLNGRPLTAAGRNASLNTTETVAIVLGGVVLVAGGVLLYADSVFDEGPGN